jgi:hypothetical protein
MVHEVSYIKIEPKILTENLKRIYQVIKSLKCEATIVNAKNKPPSLLKVILSLINLRKIR